MVEAAFRRARKEYPMSRKGSRIRPAAGVMVAALVLAAPVAAQQEGYDPLRQITQQVEKANLLVVQDRTGSMANSPTTPNKPTAGAAGTGGLYWGASSSEYTNELSGNSFPAMSWTYPASTSWSASAPYVIPASVGSGGQGSSCDPTNSSKCQVWTYVLVFEYPSRMSMVKNVFGKTVNVFTDYIAPLGGEAAGAATGFASGDWTNIGYKVTVTKWDKDAPIIAAAGSQRSPYPFYVFRIDYGTSGSGAIRRSNPGAPFSPITGGKPTVDANGTCIVGTCQLSYARDLFNQFSDRVNWGLVYFDTSATTAVGITSTGTPAADITTLQNYYGTGSGSLTPGSSTNTKNALVEAKSAIQTALDGDKKAHCNRPYGVILVTDGLSNTGNPNSGKNWIKPCNPSFSPTTCDIGGGSYDCPQNWTNFAAGNADDLYLNTKKAVTNQIVNVRTWTIGVSVQVGPCELDYIAYKGRTDASSPHNDAGWSGYDPVKNPYLPNPGLTAPLDDPNNSTTYPTNSSTYDGPTGQYKYFKNTSLLYDPPTVPPHAGSTGHGHNAFFATNADDLAEAIATIVDASATGDYATNAPTSGQSVGAGTTVILPSTQFPGWKGHLYAYDTLKDPADPKYILWDAGDLNKLNLPATLTPAEVATLQSPASRKIYTWDSARNLVAVTSGNLSQLQSIAGAYGLAPATSFTASVVSFIRGYDANATPAWSARRSWNLGPMINTTPAIQGRPATFKQTNVKPHALFEVQYKNRRPLVWVGSDDGMMHAIDFETGLEELAILPPNLLPLQVKLHDNYMLPNKASGKPGDRLTGQPDRIANHLYGVANSFRFGDVWFQSDNAYHTVGIITEGPGGNMVAAIDVTHPYAENTILKTSADPNYDGNNPFTVLWSVTGGTGSGQLNGLFKSWSVPAMAPRTVDTWDLAFGSGFNPASTAASQAAPKVFTANLSANPTSPTFNSYTLTNRAGTPSALVGNQAFADGVAFSTIAPAFHSDNLANLALQADLNGQVWFESGTDWTSRKVGIDVNALVSPALATQQPIYYSPAVTGYGASASGCDIIAFGSGSFYEQSSKVTGSAVGTGSNFIPSLYIGINPKPAAAATPATLGAANLYRLPIAGTTFNQGDKQNPTATRTLGPHTQLTSSPFVISPLNGADPAQVLFLVYDPDQGCMGESYVISLTFNVPTACTRPTISPANQIAYDAGSGAASGFAIAGNTLVVSKSGIGDGSRAGLYQPPDVVLATGSYSKVKPVWWKEHK